MTSPSVEVNDLDAVRTLPECPLSVAMHSPVVTSQILTVLSLDAETMRRPSRKISTLKTCDNGMSSTNRSCGEPQEVNTVSHRGSNTDRNNCRSMVLLVPFKSPNTFACQKLPHFERPVAASRHNAQPVRKHYNVIDLRRRHIITKSTADAATHFIRVPFQRRHAFAGRHVPDLERAVARPRNDAPPVRKFRNAKDLRRRQIITEIPQKADAAPHPIRVPFQRRHAFAGRHVPHLERAVVRPRHDAPPV